MNNFPQMLYRAEGAKIESKLVNDAEELASATAQGWGDRASAKAAATTPQRTSVIVGAGVQTAKPADDGKLRQALEAAESAQALAAAAEQVADAHRARAEALEAFLITLRDDADAPEALRADIANLLGDGAPQVTAQAKKKGKK